MTERAEDINMEDKIRRINELYHKSKSVGLTEAEKAEQQSLRKEFIASVRANVKSQLNNISIEQEDGTVENLGEKYGGQSNSH
ncbi:MAG: DUF896 domain-containing protein [Eubacteriales bacterium]|nr:DUF896 domain-containing protein [Eubacteriales bacterium]